MLPFLAATLILAGCSFGNATIDRQAMNKVQKVGVVIYTVPKEIKYRSDPRGEQSTLAQIAELAGVKNGDGTVAATVAHKEFIKTLNKQGLPFKIVSYNKMKKNSNLKKLYTQPKEKNEGNKGLLGSLLGSMSNKPEGRAPKGFNEYGLSNNWIDGKALTGQDGEKEYIQQAIKALNVDAVLVINDTGFSFACEACIASSGAASTGSAFTASLVDPSGNAIMNMREWFATTDAQAPMVTGVVDPRKHKHLFKEHGKKMAIVFADYLKGELNKKK